MSTSLPNAKICPRCGMVVPTNIGVCRNCGRLFRTPIGEPLPENKTMMFYDGTLPTPPPASIPPLPRVLRLRQWLRRIRQRAVDLLNGFFH